MKRKKDEDNSNQEAEGPRTITWNEAPKLAPTHSPLDTPYSVAELAKYDGSDDSLPVYVAVKGTIFDVSPRREMYKPGQSYGVFAGKDASKALGMSSLKIEDCIADYSSLNEKQMETLEQWFAYYSKRYNIVGKVEV